MHSALERSYRAVPPTLNDLRPRSGKVALKCYRTRCPRCSSFESDGRIPFEESLDVRRVIPWCCDTEEKAELARKAGVSDLPSYIVLPSSGPSHVVSPVT